MAVGPATNQPLLDQSIAQPRRRRRGDGHSVGQLGHALWPARGQDDKGAVLGEGDVLAGIGQRAGGDGDEDPTGAEDGIDHRVGFNVLGPAVYMHLLTIA